jgi:hypothetical protein
MGNSYQQRLSYLGRPDLDPVTRFAWQFYGSNSYGGITYGKTATLLLTLEKIIGEDTMRRTLHTYFMRYRFTHPTGEDFLKTIEEVSGKDLRWYFDQAVYGTNILDYEILNAHSDRVNWYEKKKSMFGGESDDKNQVYRTYVTVHRKGDFVFPVDVEIKFTDKQSVLEHWDGRDRWIRYVYERKAKIQSAEIDPQHQILLDRDLFNNSYVAKKDMQAVHKLAHIWLFANEWLSQLIAWIT